MSRRTELIIGMIGGILGIIASILSAFYDAMWNFTVYPYYMYSNHIALFLVSILGIIGASLVRTHSNWAAGCMIVAAILGFALSSLMYTIPAILLLIAGVISLYRGYGINRDLAHKRNI